MIFKLRSILVISIIASLLIACEEGPSMTKMPVDGDKSSDSPGLLPNRGEANDKKPVSDEIHTIVVNEVLPTSKYVYLNVNEGDRKFWVAVIKQDVVVGETYIFKGGLLKTNFESKEYNRMFEEIYLVTNLVHQHGSEGPAAISSSNEEIKSTDKPVDYEIEVIEHEGSMKIADLVADPKKYEGQTIQISGVCVKVNARIMKRNWIHLKDGSKDDYDLIVTSDIFVPEGSTVTMRGVVVLNKDYGAGYKYELIVEDGVIVK